MPSQFIGETSTSLSDNPFESQCTHVLGYSFGGLIRTSFSKRFALETGLFFNQRNFNLSMSVLDSGITAQNQLTFISYEIPIQRAPGHGHPLAMDPRYESLLSLTSMPQRRQEVCQRRIECTAS